MRRFLRDMIEALRDSPESRSRDSDPPNPLATEVIAILAALCLFVWTLATRR
jgi:hypothetical protein